MRNISFSLTTPQFLLGTKTVTRRTGWETAKAGDMMKAVKKVMGLKRGEAMEIIGQIQVVDVQRQRLDAMLADRTWGYTECIKEGFPDMSPEQFVDFFCNTHAGCFPDRVITRIEFVKL